MSFHVAWNSTRGDLLVVIGGYRLDSLYDILGRVGVDRGAVKALFVSFKMGALRSYEQPVPLDAVFPNVDELHVFMDGHKSFGGEFLERRDGSWKVLTLELPYSGHQIPRIGGRARAQHLYLTRSRGPKLAWNDRLQKLADASDRVIVLTKLVADVPSSFKISVQIPEGRSGKRDAMRVNPDWPYNKHEMLVPITFARVPDLPDDLLRRVAWLIAQ